MAMSPGTSPRRRPPVHGGRSHPDSTSRRTKRRLESPPTPAGNGTGVARGAAVRFIYENDRGFLWYDADGTGKARAFIPVILFIGIPALNAADIPITA